MLATNARQQPWAAAVVGLLLASSASADAPARLHCEPACRPGYACELGECVPQCTPRCGEGMTCTQSGECISIEDSNGASPAAVPYAAAPASATLPACRPSCRSGFTCIDGACASACNPPCPVGELCSPDRQCIPRAEPEAAALPPAKSRGGNELGSLHVDVLGAFQFGIAPTLELGRVWSGYLSVQPLNTGLGSYYWLPGSDRFVWGLGGSLGTHIFSAGNGNLRGLFGGLALGYFFAQSENKKITFVRRRTHALVPQLDLGYRAGLGHFLIGGGLRLGLSIPIAARDDAIGDDGCRTLESCNEERPLRFVASLFLDLGWFFGLVGERGT